MSKISKISNVSYNFAKSIKDKENKVLNYYKRINSLEQPKIFIVPKIKKGTKKNMIKYKQKDNINEVNESMNDKEKKEYEKKEYEKKEHEKKEHEKKLTKKNIVIMDD